MTSLARSIADAVAAALNAHTFSTVFEAEVWKYPRLEITEEEGLRVRVREAEETASMLGRTGWVKSYDTEISLQQALPSFEPELIQPLDDLLEELQAFAETRPFVTPRPLTQIVKVPPLLEQLQELKYLALLRLTFGVAGRGA